MDDNDPAGWSLRLTPRHWQTDALKLWRQECRGIVAVVTGAGKTTFAEMCMVECRQHRADIRFAIVVPSLALLDQWYVSLREDLGVRPEEIATYSGEGIPAEPSAVNLLVINTARSLMRSLTATGDWCLIVDECHRAGSDENSRALDGEFIAALGLSATPERDYDPGLEDLIIPVLGEVVFRYGYEEARRDGVVTPFDLVHVKVELTQGEQSEYEDLSRRIRRHLAKLKDEPPDEAVRRLLQRRATVAATAQMWRKSRLVGFLSFTSASPLRINCWASWKAGTSAPPSITHTLAPFYGVVI